MKTYARIFTVSVGLLSLLGSVAVKADSLALRARVPFDFTAGKTALAAGTYSVTRPGGSLNVILVRSQKQGVFLRAQRDDATTSTETSRLVFHRYGDRYFLRAVSFRGGSGYAMPETDEEREWADRKGKIASRPIVVHIPAALG
jgi:hypothetical protein